jgi:hypothetical protein
MQAVLDEIQEFALSRSQREFTLQRRIIQIETRQMMGTAIEACAKEGGEGELERWPICKATGSA